MGKLEQAAVRTPHQFQWAGGDVFAQVFREYTGQCLLAQVENRNQIRAPGNPTLAFFAVVFQSDPHT